VSGCLLSARAAGCYCGLARTQIHGLRFDPTWLDKLADDVTLELQRWPGRAA